MKSIKCTVMDVVAIPKMGGFAPLLDILPTFFSLSYEMSTSAIIAARKRIETSLRNYDLATDKEPQPSAIVQENAKKYGWERAMLTRILIALVCQIVDRSCCHCCNRA